MHLAGARSRSGGKGMGGVGIGIVHSFVLVVALICSFLACTRTSYQRCKELHHVQGTLFPIPHPPFIPSRLRRSFPQR
jgi:hypothetical protein